MAQIYQARLEREKAAKEKQQAAKETPQAVQVPAHVNGEEQVQAGAAMTESQKDIAPLQTSNNNDSPVAHNSNVPERSNDPPSPEQPSTEQPVAPSTEQIVTSRTEQPDANADGEDAQRGPEVDPVNTPPLSTDASDKTIPPPGPEEEATPNVVSPNISPPVAGPSVQPSSSCDDENDDIVSKTPQANPPVSVPAKRVRPKELNDDGSPSSMKPWMADIWPNLLAASSSDEWKELMSLWGELELRLGLPEGGRVSILISIVRLRILTEPSLDEGVSLGYRGPSERGAGLDGEPSQSLCPGSGALGSEG